MSSPWKVNYSRYKRFFLNSVSQYGKRQDLKAYLEIFLSLATIVIFTVFALRPTLLTIAKLIKEIETKEETLVKIDQKIEDLKQARRLYDQEQDKIRLLDNSVPKNPYPEAIIRQVQGTTGKSNVSVNSMSIGETTLLDSGQTVEVDKNIQQSVGGSKLTSVNINLFSSYPTLLEFVSGLESLRRPITINSLTLEASNTDTGKVIIGNVSGNTPYFEGSNTLNIDELE